MKQYLSECISKIELEISDYQIEQFDIFYHLLIEKNKVMNLTAITDMEDVVKKHFVDSMALLKYISLDKFSVIDVGTGAGFPGVPLAIMCPSVEFTLLDSLNKRLRFLDEVIQKCELSNIRLTHHRAEDGGRDMELREKYDVCVSRAVANMPVLLEYCSPFVKPGGQFISYKSGEIDGELQLSERAQQLLSCRLNKIIQFDLLEEDISRSFVFFDKVNVLSKKYPRQAGKVKKQPL